MTEPIYRYVKGEGWVVSKEEYCFDIDFRGTRCAMYIRIPVQGEACTKLFRTGSFDKVMEEKLQWLIWASRLTFDGLTHLKGQPLAGYEYGVFVPYD